MNDSSDSQITFIQPRDEVEVHLPDGRVLQGKRNTPVGEFLKALPEWDNPLIVGAIVNHELRELTYPISIESKVVPLTMASADGARILPSLTYLFAGSSF